MGNLLPAQLLPEAGAPLYHKLSFSKSTLPTAILNSKKQKSTRSNLKRKKATPTPTEIRPH